MHRDSLDLEQIEVSAQYLPDKYFHLVRDKLKIQTVTVNPQNEKIIFVGTGNGLFRSKDEGKTWQSLHEGLRDENIRALALSPSSPNMIYAGTSKGIFLSEDGGDHWTDWFEESSGLSDSFCPLLLESSFSIHWNSRWCFQELR
jgi:ligand-binding sensor domain-containing protein